MMSKDDRNDLVGDVADALTLDQKVQWERCARLAEGADRAKIENLRVIERVLASRTDAGQAPEAAEATRPYGSTLVGRAVHVLIAIATLEVAATLLLLPGAWGDYYRAHGELAVFMTIQLVGYAAAAGLLLWAGRGDWRTWLLGVYCLLKATNAPMHMLQAFFLELPPPPAYAAFIQQLPAANRLFAALYVPAFLFAPAFLWAFARECPRVHRRTWLDDLARRMIPVSVLIGAGLWVACAVTLELARAGHAGAPVAWVLDGTLATLDLLALAAVTLVALRARTAPVDEVRRVVVFSGGFLLFMGVAAAYDLAEAFAPGDWVSNYRWSPTILLMELLRFPGLILLWYAVLAARIPHLREAVRAFYRRLLMRPDLLGAVAVVPAAALAWLIGRSPERAVGAVMADPLAQSLFAAVGILLLLIAARERILIRLDAWILPETADQRLALADAAGVLAQAGRITTLGETLTRTVRRGCGSPATLLVADDAETQAGGFSAPQARFAPLPRQTAIVHLLETVGGPVRVEPDGRPSVFTLLPPDEAAWVTETGADVIVPVPGPGTDVIGVLVVGRRLDGRLVRSVDLPFLEALGAAAGLALARLQLLDAPGAGSGETRPAEECPVCRSVTEAGQPPACACGPAYVATEVPTLLAGKFRLTRRLGAGGMGAVYLARDLRLERDVAIKTLTESSFVRLVGLKSEAWAMATVTHPAVAQIPRRRVLAGPPLPGRRVPGRRHAGGPAAGRSDRPRPGRGPRRPAGRRPGGPAREGIPARRRQAKQHRVHRRGVAQAAGFRVGARGGRRRHSRRHPALPFARDPRRSPGRGSRRCLVAVRRPRRNGVGPASLRRRLPRGGAKPHPAPTPRCRRACIGDGRGRLRGVDPDGPPVAAAGDRARLRRSAGRDSRERLAKLFAPCLSGPLSPYVSRECNGETSGFLP